MSKDELLQALAAAAKLSDSDPEAGHSDADEALLRYINDKEVSSAWAKVHKWFA